MVNYLNTKIMRDKVTIYGLCNFESILMPEDNGKQNPKESYANKYQKHSACSYGYKLVCIDDKFSKPFKAFRQRCSL